MKLSQNAEEIAGFYAKMLEHDYTTKPIFNKNFFKDWRKVRSYSTPQNDQITSEWRLIFNALLNCHICRVLSVPWER